MRIALIDPFFDTSHEKWAKGLQKYSRHHIDIYADSPHQWKWKMTGGAVSMAKRINDSGHIYQLFLVTDMLHLPLFKSLLLGKYANSPFALYFHENQITYPWSPDDPDLEYKRDHHYGFINYTSALVADRVFFNSKYHFDSFKNNLGAFLRQFPQNDATNNCAQIVQKSSVLPLGLELPKFSKAKMDVPVFIWNHRWEYDKNPDLFFNTLFQLRKRNILFQLIVLGKSFRKSPEIFEKAKTILSNEIIHFGFVTDEKEYTRFLKESNIILVTSIQDFFGISTVEAIAAGCYPVLPNRLAFSEHVPEGHYGTYTSDEELTPLLIQALEQKRYLQTKAYSEFVRKYDWTKVGKLYDDTFDAIEVDHKIL